MGAVWNLLRAFRFPTSDTSVLTFDGGNLTVKGESVRRSIVSDLEGELRASACERGVIRLRKTGRIGFSEGIDPRLHQRLRNILMS